MFDNLPGQLLHFLQVGQVILGDLVVGIGREQLL